MKELDAESIGKLARCAPQGKRYVVLRCSRCGRLKCQMVNEDTTDAEAGGYLTMFSWRVYIREGFDAPYVACWYCKSKVLTEVESERALQDGGL